MTNYRSKIEEIIARYAKPGEDLSASILTGSKEWIDWQSAVGIAHWLAGSADAEWGYDPRHAQIAAEIIDLAGC